MNKNILSFVIILTLQYFSPFLEAQVKSFSGWGGMYIKTDGSLWANGAWIEGVKDSYGFIKKKNYIKWSGEEISESDYNALSSSYKIGNDNDWVLVSGGSYFEYTVAIKTNGSLWAWGRNDYGQLGDGTTTNRRRPTRIGRDNDWMLVSADGWDRTVAIKTNGSLWAWGSNEYGQLGDGTTTNRLTPTRIGKDNDWMHVSVGKNHTAAVKTDGSLWAWGANDYGQLGDGTTTSRLTPTRIGMDNDWRFVSAGYESTAAIKTNGSLWAWGGEGTDQISIIFMRQDGGRDEFPIHGSPVPMQMGKDNDWIFVSASAYDKIIYALKQNGTIWMWVIDKLQLRQQIEPLSWEYEKNEQGL